MEETSSETGVRNAGSILLPLLADASGENPVRLYLFDGQVLYETADAFDFLPLSACGAISRVLEKERIISLILAPGGDDIAHSLNRVLSVLTADDADALLALLRQHDSIIEAEVFTADGVAGSGMKTRSLRERIRKKFGRQRELMLAGHQPGYHRYLGFFDKMRRVDVFVFDDRVQCNIREYQHRQRFWISPSTPKWLTVPLQRGGSTQRINEKLVSSGEDRGRSWRTEHWSTIQDIYATAPYFADHRAFLAEFYSRSWTSLNALDEVLTRYVAKQLGLSHVILVRASHLRDSDGALPKKAALIAKTLRTVVGEDWPGVRMTYLSGDAAHDYLDRVVDGDTTEASKLTDAGIEVTFQEFQHPVYRQAQFADGAFVANLSAFDLLFNHGSNSLSILTGNRTQHIRRAG